MDAHYSSTLFVSHSFSSKKIVKWLNGAWSVKQHFILETIFWCHYTYTRCCWMYYNNVFYTCRNMFFCSPLHPTSQMLIWHKMRLWWWRCYHNTVYMNPILWCCSKNQNAAIWGQNGMTFLNLKKKFTHHSANCWFRFNKKFWFLYESRNLKLLEHSLLPLHLTKRSNGFSWISSVWIFLYFFFIFSSCLTLLLISVTSDSTRIWLFLVLTLSFLI